MKLDLHIPIKSPFWTRIWVKKGQNTPKSMGTPLAFLSYGGLLVGRFLPRRRPFCTNWSLKGGYYLQEIGHFWPFYRAILLGLGSPFLLFPEKCPKFTLFPHEIGFIYSYKKSILNYNFAKKGQNTPKSKVTSLHFYHMEALYLGTFPGEWAQEG
jgi:hypothetical protein